MPNHLHTGESSTIDISPHVRLRVIRRRGGSKLPFLLVHGLASNARLWDGVGARLAAAGHDSVAVDLRGHGESTQTGSGFDFTTLSADLSVLIDAMGWEAVVAAGQSWGANLVLELASRHPEPVAAISLIDGGFLRLRDDMPDWSEARRRLTPPSFEGMTMESMGSAMRSRSSGFSDEAVEAQLANLIVTEDGLVRNRLSLENHLTILRHLWEHDPDPVGAAVSAPIQVIAVPGGSPSKPDRVSAFARASGAEVHWVDGHHDIHAQEPQRVAELLVALASTVSS